VESAKAKEETKKHFMLRFSTTQQTTVRLDNIHFLRIDDEDNTAITRCFSEEEIKQAVWECEGKKSPGLDGFNFNFTKKV